MQALQLKTEFYSVIFASARYWPDLEEMQEAISNITAALTEYLQKHHRLLH